MMALACCQDFDECSSGLPLPCNQECNNTVGSFECICLDGYFLDNDTATCYGKILNAMINALKKY